MQDVPPDVIAVAPQTDEDRRRNRSPDYLQTIIPVTISSGDTLAGAVFDDEENVNDLGQDKNATGEKKDEPNQLIDVYPALGRVLRHPPKIGSPRISPTGRNSGQKNTQDQATASKKGWSSVHKATMKGLKYGTKVLIFVIKPEGRKNRANVSIRCGSALPQMCGGA